MTEPSQGPYRKWPQAPTDREVTIDHWMAQEKTAACLLGMQRHTWKDNDSMVWALLETLGHSRPMNEMLYDFGHDLPSDVNQYQEESTDK